MHAALSAIPLLVVAVGFAALCLVDLVRAKEVRYLPKWAWAILCLGVGLTIPFGGITYLGISGVPFTCSSPWCSSSGGRA
jgi:hypothetical protein